MSLAQQLQEVRENFHANGPPAVTVPIRESTEEFVSTFDHSGVIQIGATLPPFTMTDALNKTVTSSSLLSKGPLLVTFYRGEWCPFCNLALGSLQKHLPEIHSRGVQLVAITPELPSGTLTMTEKHDLKFPVLTDLGCKFAKELGLVWQQPEKMKNVFKSFGNDLAKKNGDESFNLPVPATILVDGDGKVRNVFVDPDYTKRLEPSTALKWIEGL